MTLDLAARFIDRSRSPRASLQHRGPFRHFAEKGNCIFAGATARRETRRSGHIGPLLSRPSVPGTAPVKLVDRRCPRASKGFAPKHNPRRYQVVSASRNGQHTYSTIPALAAYPIPDLLTILKRRQDVCNTSIPPVRLDSLAQTPARIRQDVPDGHPQDPERRFHS